MGPITVYAIRFQGGQIYVGMTDDVSRRLVEHRRRQSPSTRCFAGEFVLIYEKAFPNYSEARSHEKFLKFGAGRKMLTERQDVQTS